MGSNHKKVFSSVQLLSRVWLFATPWAAACQASLLLLLSHFSRVWLWRPHRQQLTRLPHPWDSPGKNTGVGCHFLQCMKVKSESEVTQSCQNLGYPMDFSLQGSSIHGIFQVRVLEWEALPSRQASLSITNSRSSLKLMSIELVMPSSHLILCRPLLLLPPISPSIRVFSNESTLCMRWPKYWSFSFSISPSNEYPGLISFRMDWLDLLAVQGTLKSLLQHNSSKASILWC